MSASSGSEAEEEQKDEIPPELLADVFRRSGRTRKEPERFEAQPEILNIPNRRNVKTKGRGVAKLNDKDDWDPELFMIRRTSGRNVGKKRYTYDTDSEEADEDDVLEWEYEDEDAEEEDSSPKIDLVLDHQDVKGDSTLQENGENEEDDGVLVREYLIKWQGKSHLHNEWKRWDELSTLKGAKKVQNYDKRLDEYESWKMSSSEEAIEQALVMREMQRQQFSEYIKVDRIIAMRDGNRETEYLVKWKGLEYCECTWEKESDINGSFQYLIDEFLAREQRLQSVTEATTWKKARPPFKKLEKQPSWLDQGGTLRDYQMEGLNWLYYSWCNNVNGILADEMGLGKTIQAISFLSLLQFQHHINGPFLVVVPLSTLDNWQREFRKWAPGMNAVTYIGKAESRQLIRDEEFYFWKQARGKGPAKRKVKFNVLVTTYELVLKDKTYLKDISWAFLMIDEAHRLKNVDAQLRDALVEFHSENRLLITGTPLQNSIRELWSLLNFLSPEKFSSLEAFEEEYSDFGEEGVIQQLHAELKPHLLRRLKKDVEKSLPGKTERILRVQRSPMQNGMYRSLFEKNIKELHKGLHGQGKKGSLLNIMVQLRKVCNHPYLIEGAEDPNAVDKRTALVNNCGKMVLLHKLLARLKDGGHRVLIFSQMVRMLDILADYLTLYGYKFQRLDGTMGSEIRNQCMDHFNAPDSTDFCFLLSTRAGGLGINLSTADTVIIFDSDWNPQNDLQAVARAHRIGQTKTVNIYRFITKDSVEEAIIERAKKKMVLDHLVIQRMETSGKELIGGLENNTKDDFSRDEINAILKFGAVGLFTEESAGGDKAEEQKNFEEMDLDDILARAEERTTDEAGGAGADLLASFKVADYMGPNIEEEKPPEGNPQDDPEFWGKLYPEGLKQVQEKEQIPLWLPDRAAKKAANVITSVTPAEGSSEKKKKKPARKPNSDDKMLTPKEARGYIRAVKRFGSVERTKDLAKDASLTHKTENLLKTLGEELVKLAKEATSRVSALPTNSASADGAEKEGEESLNSFDFHGAEVNGPEILHRMLLMSVLEGKVKACEESPDRFRIGFVPKPPNFSIEWLPKDDAMLLLGVYRYGWGNWEAIREDESLGLKEKIIKARGGTEEKGVKPPQLSRRVETILKLMTEKELPKSIQSSEDSETNTFKEKRKPDPKEKRKSEPKEKRKLELKDEQETHDQANDGKMQKHKGKKRKTGEGDGESEKGKKRKRSKNDEKKETQEKNSKTKPITPSSSTSITAPKSLLAEVDEEIKGFQALQSSNLPQEKIIQKTKKYMWDIGLEIDFIVSKKMKQDKNDGITDAEYREKGSKLEEELWNYVSTFTVQDGPTLRRVYRKIKQQKKEKEKEKKGEKNEKPKNLPLK